MRANQRVSLQRQFIGGVPAEGTRGVRADFRALPMLHFTVVRCPVGLFLLGSMLLGCGAEGDGEDAPSPVAGLFEDIGPCRPAARGDRLFLRRGCVDGICVGMTAEEIEAVTGGPMQCFGEGPIPAVGQCETTVVCTPMPYDLPAVGITFLDADEDERPDPGARAFALHLQPPWDMTSPRGLGPGASIRCFLDAFGLPDEVGAGPSNDGTTTGVTRVQWYEPDVVLLGGPSSKSAPADMVVGTIQLGVRAR